MKEIALRYISSHWRGETRLPVSFWINGLLFYVLSISLVVATSPFVPFLLLATLWVAVFVWQIVGIVKASIFRIRYGATTLSRGWGVLALFSMVSVVLLTARDLFLLSS